MLQRILLYVIFLSAPMALIAQQTRFTASSDAKQVLIGTYFEVSYKLENGDGRDFVPPSFSKDFKVINGPNQSMSTSIINGKMTRSMGYSYNLQPKKVGTFTIKPATIKVAGKTLRSNSIRVQVLKGKKGATAQSQLDSDMDKNVYITAEPSVTEAVVGQQVNIDYKIYTKVNVDSYNLLSEPDYDGFFKHDIESFDDRVLKEIKKGDQFTTKVLKRVALFPQQAGKFVIEPLNIRIGIRDENSKRRGFFRRSIPHNVSTGTLEITVKTLPSNAPPSFNGAVGKFKMRPTINRNQMSTDDAITLRMFVEGDGDIKRVQPPILTLDEEIFELYDPRVVDDGANEVGGNVQGQKVFEYTILPKKAGRYTITPKFSFYDPDSSSYVVLNPQKFVVSISQGSEKKVASEANFKPGTEIKPLKNEVFLSNKPNPFFGSIPYWLMSLLPFLAIGGVAVYKKKLEEAGNIDPLLLKKQQAKQEAEKRLTTAKAFMEKRDGRSFYDEVSQASAGYICDKLNIPMSELTKANVKEQLSVLKVKESNIDRYLKVVKTCEMALFAGKDNDAAMQETYQEAIGVISDIEEEVS